MALALSASAAQARMPPFFKEYRLGTDSQGRSWMATARSTGVTLVGGSSRHTVALAFEGAGYLSVPLITILPEDRAVIVAESGRGVLVTLASGASRPITLPSQSKRIVWPFVKAGQIWYVDDAPPGESERVMRYDPASDKGELRFTGEPGLSIHSLSFGGDVLWMSGINRAADTCHVLAFDVAASKVVTHFKQKAPAKAYLLDLDVESDTVAWVFDGSRVQRVEVGGAVSEWSVSPRWLAGSLILDGKLVVVAGRSGPKGPEYDSPPTLVDVVVGLIDPKKDSIEAIKLSGTFPEGFHIPVARAGADRIDVGGRTVRIVDGKLVGPWW